MFSMAGAGLSIIVAILGIMVPIVKWAANYFGDSATLRRLQLRLERAKAKREVEIERLRAANQRIDSAPDKTGQELTDSLNEKFKKDKPE